MSDHHYVRRHRRRHHDHSHKRRGPRGRQGAAGRTGAPGSPGASGTALGGWGGVGTIFGTFGESGLGINFTDGSVLFGTGVTPPVMGPAVTVDDDGTYSIAFTCSSSTNDQEFDQRVSAQLLVDGAPTSPSTEAWALFRGGQWSDGPLAFTTLQQLTAGQTIQVNLYNSSSGDGSVTFAGRANLVVIRYPPGPI
jgi:hypothetical protein